MAGNCIRARSTLTGRGRKWNGRARDPYPTLAPACREGSTQRRVERLHSFAITLD